MVEGHKIVKSIPLEYYLNLIADYSNDEIIISDHTMFRIREKDRKIFKDISSISTYMLINNIYL